MVDLARQAFSTNNFGLAAEIYERTIKENGPQADLYLGLADSFARGGQFTKAFDAYTNAFRLGRVTPEKLKHLVTALIESLSQDSSSSGGQQNSMKKSCMFTCVLCRGLLNDPVTIKCGHTFCRKCLERDRTKTCKVCGIVHYRLKPANIRTNVVLSSLIHKWFPDSCRAAELKTEGNKFFEKRDFERAIKFYSEAISLSDADHLLFSNRSHAYNALDQYDKALEDAEKVVKMRPDWPKGFFRKGLALYGLGRYEEAVIAFLQCLALDKEVTSAKEYLSKSLHMVLSQLPPDDPKALQRQREANPSLFQALVNSNFNISTFLPHITANTFNQLKQIMNDTVEEASNFMPPSQACPGASGASPVLDDTKDLLKASRYLQEPGSMLEKHRCNSVPVLKETSPPSSPESMPRQRSRSQSPDRKDLEIQGSRKRTRNPSVNQPLSPTHSSPQKCLRLEEKGVREGKTGSENSLSPRSATQVNAMHVDSFPVSKQETETVALDVSLSRLTDVGKNKLASKRLLFRLSGIEQVKRALNAFVSVLGKEEKETESAECILKLLQATEKSATCWEFADVACTEGERDVQGKGISFADVACTEGEKDVQENCISFAGTEGEVEKEAFKTPDLLYSATQEEGSQLNSFVSQSSGSEAEEKSGASNKKTISADLLSVEDLECSLCYRLFYKPVTTPCGHSFCCECLDRCMDHQTSCPMCKSSLAEYLAERRSTMTECLQAIIVNYFEKEYIDRQKVHEEEINELAKMGLDTQHEIPVFVCTLGFPSVPCPLHIFEPRYRLMIRQCMESGTRQFGMCACLSDNEENFSDYGCMLEVRDVHFFADGRSLVDTVGGRRFRVLGRGKRDGYNTAKVEFLSDDPVDQAVLPELQQLQHDIYADMKKWLDGLPAVHKARISQHFGTIPTMDPNPSTNPNGPHWAWWCIAVLPIDTRVQLALLAMGSFKERLEAMKKVLQYLGKRHS